METIKEVLIGRDGMSAADADELIAEAKEDLFSHIADGNMGADVDIMAEYFGLEPDYIIELL